MEIKTPKILAIDDNPDNLITLNALIKEAFPGALVFTAISGEKGLKLAVDEDPDVILLDIVMPGMDGFEVCRKLKEDRRLTDIPVVFVTALKGDKESRIRALECGGEAFLAKPVDESELTAQIRAMVKIKTAKADKRDENERLKRLVEERTALLQKELNDRKIAEKLLRESEERFRDIFVISPDAVAISEVETGVYVEVNAAFEKLSGFARKDILGKSSVELGFWMEAEDRENYIQRIKTLGAVDNQEASFRIKDGSLVHTIVSSRIISLSGQSLMLNVIKDITERKLNERALRQSEFQFREFFEKAADAIFIAEIETGIIVDANEAATRLMLMSKDQLTGLHQTQLHPPVMESYSKDTFTMHKKLVSEKVSSYAIENTVLRADGMLVPVEILASEVEYHGKQCMMGTFRDITERKRSEAALWESQINFRALFDKGPIGVAYHQMIYDETGKPANYLFLDANESYQKLTGVNPVGKLVTEAFPGIERDPFNWIETFGEVAKTGKEIRFQQCLQPNNRWYDCVGYQYKPDHFVAAFFEITAKMMAEVALQESNDLNNSLLQTIPFGMDIVDEDGTILFQNENFENVFGKDKLGRKCWDLYCDDKKQCSGCPLRKGIEIGQTATYESSGVMGGMVFEISHTGMMYKGKKAMLEIFMDITERKRTELALQESKQLFQGLFNVSPDAIVLLDPHHPDNSWPILDCNIAACRMNGYSREELIGQSIDLLNVTKGTDQERTRFFNVMKQQGVTHFESLHRHKDGHTFPIEISSSLVVIGGQEMVLGIDRDITERKKAEAEIQKSYDLLNKLAEQVPGVVYQYRLYPDGSSAFPYASPGMNDIYEVTPEEVREDASPVFTRIHPDDYTFIVETITESARNNTLFHTEFRVILPGQGLRWRLCDAKPERLEDGSTIWHGIITDITDRKQGELALKESEDRYKSFISQVTEGVYRFECDVPMDVTLPQEEQVDFIYDHFFMAECNDAIVKMYKLSDQSQFIGKSHLDFHGGRDNPVNRELVRTFIRNGYSIENGITHEVDSAGQLRYISNNSVGIVENGYLIRTWGTETDITEKIKTGQVQQVLYAISNAALSSIDLAELIGIISTQLGQLLDSSNFFIAFYNEETGMLSTLYEKDEKDNFGSWPAEKSITGYVIRHQKSVLASEADMNRLHETGETELVGTASKIWLGVPLSVNNKVIGAIVVQSYDNPNAYTEKDQLMLEFVSQQISISIERKMAEEELKLALTRAQESDRLKSSFLANMSHEIRTPLNSIIGFSDLLLDPDFEIEQKREFAEAISSGGSSLLAIISDIMDISKIEAGQVVLNRTMFSVNGLIAEIRKEYAYKALEKQLELRLDPSSPVDDVLLESDEPKLKQILVNFVGNALKFTENGFIQIGFSTKGNVIQFQVWDSGIGIPAEFHSHIFERFRQVESADSRKYGGNGLGLAISKSLANLLGGEIGMESEPGKGSMFFVKIPIN